MAIRSYGPGKFNTLLDSYLYELSLDGVDEELGDAQDFGWYGTLLFGSRVSQEVRRIAAEHRDRLSDEEVQALKDSVGVMLFEDSNGFVTVVYFRKDSDLDAAWQDVMAAYEDWLGPDE